MTFRRSWSTMNSGSSERSPTRRACCLPGKVTAEGVWKGSSVGSEHFLFKWFRRPVHMPYSRGREIHLLSSWNAQQGPPDCPHPPLLPNTPCSRFAGRDTCNESQAVACEDAHLVVSFHENTRLSLLSWEPQIIRDLGLKV